MDLRLRRTISLAAFAVVFAASVVAGLKADVALSSSSSLSDLPPSIVASLPSFYRDPRTANTALVEVYAGDFISMIKNPLKNHPVKVFIDTFDESKAQLLATDNSGFLRMQVGVGSKVFVTSLAGSGFHETTTAISTVPAEGLSGQMNRICLQVPSDIVFDLFAVLIGRPMPAGTCPVVVTITQYNTSYDTAPQGWDGVAATIDPASAAVGEARPYYFGMFPFINKTNPLPNNRTTTSEDGGVVFPAIPVNAEKDYIIGAKYESYQFTTSAVRCLRGGQFINAAPNQGPRALKRITEDRLTKYKKE